MDTLRHIGDAEFISDAESRMFLKLFPGQFVRPDIEPAPPLRVRNETRHRHWTFHHRWQLVTNLHLFNIAWRRTTNFFRLIERKNFTDVFARIRDRLLLFDLSIFRAALTGGIALG